MPKADGRSSAHALPGEAAQAGGQHLELDGVAGEALQAQRGVVPGCAFATHPTVSIRVVVDDLSLQRLGDHNLVARELELGLAGTCMAAKLKHAGCEIATKKSKVPNNPVSAWAKLRRAGNWGRAKSREASIHSGAVSAAGEVQRACGADQENLRQVVGAVLARAGAHCARLSVKGVDAWQESHDGADDGRE